MKSGLVMLSALIGVVSGAIGGYLVAREQARAALIVGPYSDNYLPALAAIAEAKIKIQSGNANVLENLNAAQDQIEQAQHWTRRFLGLPVTPPNSHGL